MNREDTKKAIEVMQAYVDGAEIETKYFGFSNDEHGQSDSAWQKISGLTRPVFNWDAADYRIKPKPREFWIDHNSDRFYATEPPHWIANQITKVREVIE